MNNLYRKTATDENGDTQDVWIEITGPKGVRVPNGWRKATLSEWFWRSLFKPRLSIMWFVIVLICLAIAIAANVADNPFMGVLSGVIASMVTSILERITTP